MEHYGTEKKQDLWDKENITITSFNSKEKSLKLQQQDLLTHSTRWVFVATFKNSSTLHRTGNLKIKITNRCMNYVQLMYKHIFYS